MNYSLEQQKSQIGTSKHMQNWQWGFDDMQTCDIDKHSR